MDVEETASLNGRERVEEEHAMANADKAVRQEADTTVYSFDSDESISAKRQAPDSDIVLPDFRNLGNKHTGLQTELGTSDVNQIKDALSAAQKKPVIQPVKTKHVRKPSTATPRTPHTPHNPRIPQVSRIPEWYRVGWTAFSNQPNPGGPFQLAASEKKPEDAMERAVSALLYKDSWNHAGAIFLIGIAFWVLGKLGGGIVTFCVGFLFVTAFHRITAHRFERHARDDIQRELIKARFLEQDGEPVEWLNSFLQEFWLIFEPVLSSYVIENIDTYLVDYLPGFLDSVRLTTFTLGSKPFRIENVRTIHETAPDIVCMDWTVTFRPEDTTDMSKTRIAKRVSPKVVLTIRLGKGMVGAGIPVLVEDMSFKGEMRVKLKFMSNFPHVKIVDACFMQKPQFDYVLKPIGGETFGFDVTNIPGLQSFVRDQVHAILGPMMYYPNVFSFDVEKFFSGELDITQANGVLAITVYYATALDSREISGTVNPYIRFYLNKAQELGRTSVQYNTVEPRWNETHFLMLNNLNSLLSLELRNQTGGSKDRRIGRANFELKQLEEEHNYAREGLELDLRHNAKPLGRLKVDMLYLPVSKPVLRDDGTIEPAAESNSGILRFTVHECRNLGSSRVSPYVRVLINGTERITTPVFKRNPNPKFERPGEVVVLDQTAVYIRVEVRDSISFAEDPVIGLWRSYLSDMMQEMEENDGWWNLIMEDGTKLLGRIRLSMQWKPVVMTGLSEAMGGHGLYNPPVGVVKLVCWGAKGLRNVEGLTSKSDPYVRVLSGSQVRARTEVVDNNLDPEWGETLYVPVHSHKEDLVLEVMDWEAKSKDRTLGFTVLHMKDLVRQRVKQVEDDEEEKDEIKWYESTGRKIDEWVPLRSSDRKTTKGELRYSAEFYPSLALPPSAQVPERDLHDCPIRRTPDDLVDLFAYNSGILTVKIHEVKLPHSSYAYCALIVDSLLPQFTTTKLKGRTLTFNETSDAFVKEADFSRVAIEVKPADATEKSDEKLGFWIGKVSDIVRQIQRKRRSKPLVVDEQDNQENQETEDDGEWFQLLGTMGGPGRIRLSFDFVPLINFTLDPSESLDNQGQLTVTLLDGKNLMAVDKSGTSDPYVVFTVNGTEVHKSEAIKKTVNPVWKNETFTVPIQSRVTASFRLEVFDWNRFSGRVPLGSGGISLRGDLVESFVARQVSIPLNGVEGVSGYIRVRFLWQPQLLIRKKTHTSVLGDTRLTATTIPSPSSSNTLSPNSAATMRPRNMLQPAQQPAPPPAPSQLQPSLSLTRPRKDSLQNLNNHSRHQRTRSDASSIMSFQTIRGNNDAATGVDGHVTITLVEARNLRGVDKSGTSDPFVRVRIGKNQVHKTKHVKKTLAPEWNETFQYSVSSKPTIIDFKVKDHNRFSSSVELGHCQWNLWELIQPQQGVTSRDQWLPLYPSGHGELHIKIQFHQ